MGVSNPSNLKPIQEIRTYPRSESVELKMQRPEVIQDRNTQISSRVLTAAPFPVPDDWSKEISWTVDQGVSRRPLWLKLPVVDQSGQIRTDQDMPRGTYRITASSFRIAAVAATVEIHVASPADAASQTQKTNQAKAVKPSAGHQFTVASSTALRTVLANAERGIGDPDALQTEADQALSQPGRRSSGAARGAFGRGWRCRPYLWRTHQPCRPGHGRKESANSSSDTGNTVLSATGASVGPAILITLALLMAGAAIVVAVALRRRHNTDERES